MIAWNWETSMNILKTRKIPNKTHIQVGAELCQALLQILSLVQPPIDSWHKLPASNVLCYVLCLGRGCWWVQLPHLNWWLGWPKCLSLLLWLGRPSFRKTHSNLDFSKSPLPPPPPQNFWIAYFLAHPDFKIYLPPLIFLDRMVFCISRFFGTPPPSQSGIGILIRQSQCVWIIYIIKII